MQKATPPPGWPSEDNDEGLLASRTSSSTSEGSTVQAIEELEALLRELAPLQRQCRAKLERLLQPYGITDSLATTQGDLIGLALVAGGQAFIGPLAPLGRPLTIADAIEELMAAFPARVIGGLLVGDFVLAKHFMLCAKRCWPRATTLPAHALAERIGDWAGGGVAVDALLAALHALTREPRERWREIINSSQGGSYPIGVNPTPKVPMVRVLLPGGRLH